MTRGAGLVTLAVRAARRGRPRRAAARVGPPREIHRRYALTWRLLERRARAAGKLEEAAWAAAAATELAPWAGEGPPPTE